MGAALGQREAAVLRDERLLDHELRRIDVPSLRELVDEQSRPGGRRPGTLTIEFATGAKTLLARFVTELLP